MTISENMDNLAINITIGIVFFGFLIWISYLHLQLLKTKKQLNIFCSGKDGKSLEEIITICSQGVESNQEGIKQLLGRSKNNKMLALSGIQNTSVIRFNPFKDVGGDQSFVAVFLNAHGDGAVISSLASREGTRIYAKPIINRESEYQLTSEEKEAIEKAMG